VEVKRRPAWCSVRVETRARRNVQETIALDRSVVEGRKNGKLEFFKRENKLQKSQGPGNTGFGGYGIKRILDPNKESTEKIKREGGIMGVVKGEHKNDLGLGGSSWRGTESGGWGLKEEA